MSRRLNGEGTVYRDSRGNYVARFQDGWNPETGRPRIRSFSAPTKQGALKRMRAYQKQKRVLKDIPILQTYLSEAMLDWLENKKKLQLKPTSYDRLCSTVSNHIIPKLGNRVIAEINSDMIQSELITPIYKSGLSQSSVRKVYQALNNFFEQLIIEDKLVKNPLKGVVLPSESSFSKTKVIRALSLEEIKRLEAAATRKCESVDKPVYRFGYYYMFILYTGIRCGEALALKWKNVDVENKKLGERNINLSSLLAMVTVNDSDLCVDSDDIYVYDEAKGCYKKQSKSDIQTLIAGKVTYGQRLKLSSKDISDAAKLLITVPEIKGNINNDHPTLVNCRNGVFDITKGKLKKHSAKYKFSRCIQANYNPDAKGKVFQRFINEACGGDKKLICLVQEVLGYAFSYSSDVKSAVIFYGPHNTGKSTILSMITNMWGTENVSNVNIQDYNTSCFAAQIMDKAINIAPDLPSDEIKDISVFKSMVSAGDSITTKKLYSNPKSAPCKAKHYFGANQFIALSKKLTAQNLEALFSRLIFIPFEHQRSAETMNHRLIEELKEESDFIFTWSMEGLIRLKKNNWEFSKCRRSEELLEEYRCQYSPEASFFNKYLEKDKGSLLLTSEVQERYAEYAVLNGVCCGTHDMINYIKAAHPDIPRKKKRCGDKNPRSVYVGLRFKDDIEF